MKRMVKSLIMVLLALVVLSAGSVSVCFADAVIEDWWDTFSPADYYVYVAAPDGGVNLRYGPGAGYEKMISSMIPNGTRLHIDGTARADNGKLWGETEYSGYWGFVFLGQCSQDPPAQTQSQAQTQAQSDTQATVKENTPAQATAQNTKPAADTGSQDQNPQAAPARTPAAQADENNTDLNGTTGSDTEAKADVAAPGLGGSLMAGAVFFNPFMIILALIITALLIIAVVITLVILFKKNGRR